MPPVRINLPAAHRNAGPPPALTTLNVRPRNLSDRIGQVLSFVFAWMSLHSHTLVSACVHLAVAGILAAFVFSKDAPRATLDIEAHMGGEIEGLPGDATNVGELPALKLDEPNPRDLLPMAGAGGIADDLPPPGLGTGPLRAGAGNPFGGDDTPGGQDVEVNVGFFGTAAEGRTFVFIVDASGSMEENNRWGRAITELSKSIGKLKPHQEFYVYFFSDADKTMRLFDPRPAEGLVKATPANKQRAQRWIKGKNIRPGGLTNPEMALEEGLQMKPDVVFLMTDGEFDDPEILVARIARLNGGTTSIHTIALQNDGGAESLEAIAKQNRGTYRFVK